MSAINRLKFVVTGAALVLVAVAQGAAAAPILSVGGPVDSAVTIRPGEAAAVSFELTQGFDNLTLSADLLCVGCTGIAWLQRDLLGETGNSFANLVTAVPYGPGVSPLFTGVTLTPDLYFLIVSIDSGFAIWSASSVATAAVFEAPGIENLLDFLAADTRPWVPFSDFRADFDHGRLHYSIDQVDAVVPEPATALLVLIGIAARGRRRA